MGIGDRARGSTVVCFSMRRRVTWFSTTAALWLLAGLVVPSSAGAAYPGTNGVIAFMRAGDIWTVNPDGSGERNITNTPDLNEEHPAISPDGTRIAYDLTLEDFDPGVIVADIDGGNPVNVVPSPSLVTAGYPTWSGDGSQVAFSAWALASDLQRLYVVNADGTNGRWLNDENTYEPAWSPTRAEIAVLDYLGNLRIVNVATGDSRPVVTTNTVGGFINDLSWSPDGSLIAFTCNGASICRVSRAGTGFVALTDRGVFGPDAEQPAYSPDGTRIVYRDSDHTLYTMPSTGLAVSDSGVELARVGTDPDWGWGGPPPPRPDLFIWAVGDPATAAAPGDAFSAWDTTRNRGEASAASSRTRYYLSTDTVRNVGDRLLGGIRTVPALASATAAKGSVTVTVPAATPHGTYYLLACADAPKQIVEANERNNCRASAGTVTVSAPLPDLTVSALSEPPAQTPPGGSLSVEDTTRNDGDAASPATVTRLYLSPDATLDEGDAQVGQRGVAALAPGAASSATTQVTVPDAPGTYRLLACADGAGEAAESDETDNCRASSGTVTVVALAPDLVVRPLATVPTTLAPGQTVTLLDTTRNAGTAAAAPTRTRYYLSLDARRNAGDRLLHGARSVAELAPGAESSGSRAVTVPSTVSPGTFYLLACADDFKAVTESREANNCRASASTLTVEDAAPVATADLVVTSISDAGWLWWWGGEWAPFTVTDTTANNGTAAAGASTTRYYLSVDRVRGAGDVLLGGTRAVGALGAGADSSGSGEAKVPTDMPAGDYYVLACADDTGAVAESNENNNCRASASQLEVAPPS